MDITKLTSADLKTIGAFLDRKEKLLAEIETVDSELASFWNGETPLKAETPKGKALKTVMRAKRGDTKDKIIAVLQSAGSEGLHIKDISAKSGVKLQTLHVWFYSTGKKIKEIRKVAPATYAWNGGSDAEAKPTKSRTKKAKGVNPF